MAFPLVTFPFVRLPGQLCDGCGLPLPPKPADHDCLDLRAGSAQFAAILAVSTLKTMFLIAEDLERMDFRNY